MFKGKGSSEGSSSKGKVVAVRVNVPAAEKRAAKAVAKVVAEGRREGARIVKRGGTALVAVVVVAGGVAVGGERSEAAGRRACPAGVVVVREDATVGCDLVGGVNTLSLYMLARGDWRARCDDFGGVADTYRVRGRLVRMCYGTDF